MGDPAFPFLPVPFFFSSFPENWAQEEPNQLLLQRIKDRGQMMVWSDKTSHRKTKPIVIWRANQFDCLIVLS
jgi:hypothetical protein